MPRIRSRDKRKHRSAVAVGELADSVLVEPALCQTPKVCCNDSANGTLSHVASTMLCCAAHSALLYISVAPRVITVLYLLQRSSLLLLLCALCLLPTCGIQLLICGMYAVGADIGTVLPDQSMLSCMTCTDYVSDMLEIHPLQTQLLSFIDAGMQYRTHMYTVCCHSLLLCWGRFLHGTSILQYAVEHFNLPDALWNIYSYNSLHNPAFQTYLPLVETPHPLHGLPILSVEAIASIVEHAVERHVPHTAVICMMLLHQRQWPHCRLSPIQP